MDSRKPLPAPHSPSSQKSAFLTAGQLALPDARTMTAGEQRLWDSLPQFVAPSVPGTVHPYYGQADKRLGEALRSIIAAAASSTASTSTSGNIVSTESSQSGTRSAEPQPSNPQAYRAEPATRSQLSPQATSAQTQLRVASEHGDLPAVRRLIKQFREGALRELSVNQAVATTGMAALHYAAARGHVDVVRELCEEGGAVVDLPDGESETALMKAAYGGHVDVVQWLVRSGANMRRGDRDGWTPLHNAAGRGHMHVAQFLVTSGAMVDARSRQGHTPLMNAASTGHAAIVRCLLANGAQPLAYNAFAECAYDVAAIAQHAHVCDLLEAAERRVWAEMAAEPYDPMLVHTTQLVSLFENQRATARPRRSTGSTMGALAHRLSFFSRSKSPVESALSSGANTPAPFVDSDFSPANLTHGDPAPMTDSAMIARRLRDIPLPHADSGMDWFWLSDWAAFVGSKPELAEDGVVAQLTDRNGWEYSAHGFNSPETVWAPYVPADAADCVRRRRWVRAMKRQVPLDDPTAVIAANPVLAKINHDHAAPALDSDYLETARSILDATRDIATSDAAVERRLELEQTRSAVSVLLSNIATDHNNDRRREARRLADDALKRAEVLAAGLQGDTQDELCQALNETENALGIMSLPGSADAVVPPPLPQRTRVEPPTDPLEVERQVQGYLEQAEREFTPAVVPPKDEVVEEFDDDRLFDKTVHHIKPTKAARSDGSVSDVVAKVTITESGSVEEEEAGGNSSSSRLDNSQIANNNDAEEEEEELADTELSPQDLRTALFMRQSLPESAWEPDEATSTCRQDARRFTLFLRRHHCRRCGLVFCDSCSSQRALLASPVSPAGFYGESADSSLAPYHPPGGESCWQLREQRVCNACFDTLASVPPINSELVQLPVVPHHSGTIENAYTIFGSPEDPIADLQSRHHSHRHRRRVSSSSIRICPVCDKDWVAVWQNMVRMPGEGWQEAQERHIRECIEDTSAGMQGGVSRHHAEAAASDPAAPSPVELPRRSVGFLSFFDRLSPTESEQPQQPVVPHHQPASQPEQSLHTMSHSARAARSPMGVKYIAYRLTGDTQLLGQECAICFEDFEPGQTVARLNCLCTYHLECIAEWLQRTPACPVHYE